MTVEHFYFCSFQRTLPCLIVVRLPTAKAVIVFRAISLRLMIMSLSETEQFWLTGSQFFPNRLKSEERKSLQGKLLLNTNG